MNQGTRARWPQASTYAFSDWVSVFGFPALAQSEAFSVHFQYMHVVGEAVENGTGQAF